MKKISLFIGLICACLSNAQIKFEKGYFIDNSGERSEVLIKNLDWKNNPKEFEYQTENSSDIKKENIKNIQEFGIDNETKYVRRTVMIDRSSEQLNNMSEDRQPSFKEETLFLKSLIEGKANLYYYEERDVEKFFFNTENSDLKQLVYKSYYINESQIGRNNEYKKQISENLKCGIDIKEIENANYKSKDLSKIFMKYNNCSNSNSVNYYEKTEKKDLFNLSIRPGFNSSTLEITDTYSSQSQTTKFDRESSFRIGLEFEFILPFNKNKWALFFEPTYQYYKSETESVIFPGQLFEAKFMRSVDYKSIEIPFGIRHYLFLNDKSKIFVNAAYVVDLKLTSNIHYDSRDLEIYTGHNFAFGVGYKYNDKFSAEIRLATKRDVLHSYQNWDSNYQTTSLILGYTLF